MRFRLADANIGNLLVAEGDLHVRVKIPGGQLLLLRQRVVVPHQRHVTGLPQKLILQPRLRQTFQEVILVLRMIADDSQHVVSVGHGIDHAHRAGFQNIHLHVPLIVKGAYVFGCRLGDIADPGNGQTEQLMAGILSVEDRVHFLELSGDLLRVYQEFRPPLCRNDALGGSLEDGKAHGGLHVPDGLAEGWLAHKQIICRLRNGACFFNLDRIDKILCIHTLSTPVPRRQNKSAAAK